MGYRTLLLDAEGHARVSAAVAAAEAHSAGEIVTIVTDRSDGYTDVALAWAVLVAVVSIPLTLVIIGFGTWALGMALLGLWAAYRVARGWMQLNARQSMRRPRQP